MSSGDQSLWNYLSTKRLHSSGRILHKSFLVELLITQEIVPEAEWPEDWEKDDAEIESVMQLAANSPLEHPQDFERLKADLEELNSARNELLELMEAYGKDPKVMKEIGEIERQRSAVVKQVVSLI